MFLTGTFAVNQIFSDRHCAMGLRREFAPAGKIRSLVEWLGDGKGKSSPDAMVRLMATGFWTVRWRWKHPGNPCATAFTIMFCRKS